METKSKLETYIGFSIKAGKCRFGLNTVEGLKRAKLIIVCKTASENTKSQALKISKKLGCQLKVTLEKTLDDYTYRQNCKIIALEDASLSKAILENCQKEFIAGE